MSSEPDMGSFRAVVIEQDDGGRRVALTQFPRTGLMEGDVTIRITHSSLNYKDGLALTGKAPVVRRYPMIPGIDGAGIVERSGHPGFRPGDGVVITGWGTGETHLGSFAEEARVPGDWLVRLPDGMSCAEAMAVGTAGLTAMLCLLALEGHGIAPADGPALVTGAAGGVGSMAIAWLAAAGWHVVASTGRAGEAEYLHGLGAREIVDRAEFAGAARPLGKERWAAAIEPVGSATLANVLSQMRYGGAVAACGLAGGTDLPGHVAPFILRGVTLFGIDSVKAPPAAREAAWARIARDLDRARLAAMTATIGLADVIPAADEILAGRIRGRVVVEVTAS